MAHIQEGPPAGSTNTGAVRKGADAPVAKGSFPVPQATPQATAGRAVDPCDPVPTGSSNQPHCSAKNKSGDPCGAFRLHGSTRCAFHDPAYRPALLRAASKGGRNRRTTALPLPENPLDLTTRNGIREAAQHVLELQFAGRINHRQASQLNRLIATAQRSLDSRQDELAEGDELLETLAEIMPAIREQYRQDYSPTGR